MLDFLANNWGTLLIGAVLAAAVVLAAVVWEIAERMLER